MGGKKLARTRFMNQVVISQPPLTEVSINHSDRGRMCTRKLWKLFRRGVNHQIGVAEEAALDRSTQHAQGRHPVTKSSGVNARYGAVNADLLPLAARPLTAGNSLCYSPE